MCHAALSYPRSDTSGTLRLWAFSISWLQSDVLFPVHRKYIEVKFVMHLKNHLRLKLFLSKPCQDAVIATLRCQRHFLWCIDGVVFGITPIVALRELMSGNACGRNCSPHILFHGPENSVVHILHPGKLRSTHLSTLGFHGDVESFRQPKD